MATALLRLAASLVALATGLSALLLFAPCAAHAQAYGLTSRAPIGPYLDGRLPVRAPSAATGWSAVPAFPNLTFRDPVFLTSEPRSNRLVVCSLWGVVYRFENNPSAATATVFLDVSNRTQVSDNSGLLGLAFHPDYGDPASPNRGYVYVFYQYTPQAGYGYKPAYNRLSRFTVPDGATAADPSSELVLIDQWDPHVWHNGGGMFFGPDGFLYVSVGAAGGTNDSYNVSQRLDLGLFSGVLRIDVDRDPTRSHPIRRQPRSTDPTFPSVSGNYYIPNDNPFLDPNGSILEEFWAIGLRSPHRLTLDPLTHQIWCGDVGQNAGEEVNLIERAGNYQWAFREGLSPGPKPRPDTIIGIEQPPLYRYLSADGDNSVIGGYVYRGREHAALLDGLYIFGDNGSGRIWALQHGGGASPQAIYLCNLPGGTGMNGLSSFGVDANGELYLCKLGADGRIYKLARTGVTEPEPPARLSQTGVFANLATLTPAAGLIPYDVNSPLWSDHAAKRRWIAVPNNGSPYAADETIAFAATGPWVFPAGTVFVKHFELPIDERDPSLVRRLETRLLVRDANGGVYGLTYKWRADGTDADLLPGSLNEDVVVRTATGTRTQTWAYPSRQACLSCHTDGAGHVLGVNTRQLNGNFTYPSTGVRDNQLRTLNRLGLFAPAIAEANIPSYAKLAPLTDTSASLEHRVRSYIDANCAHCHQPSGARGFFDARFDTPLDEQGIIDGPLANSLGSDDMHVVTPASLDRSFMYLRMNTVENIKMPPLARNEIDPAAVNTLADWINSLRPSRPLPSAWQQQDVGNVIYSGAATYSSGTYTVQGAGRDIWDNADSFHYVYQPFSGDGQIVARVLGVQNTDAWAKGGIMFRESLSAGARNAFMLLTPSNGIVFQQRATTNGPTGLTGGVSLPSAVWLRLTRQGTTFSGYYSADGTNWTLLGTATLDLGVNIYVGLAVTSHQPEALCAATFDQVALAGGGAPLPPTAPSTLTAAAVSSSRVDLRWTDNSTNEDGFVIERAGAGGNFTVIAVAAANTTTYADADVLPSTAYSYRVRASGSGGDSAASNVASVTTPAPPPPDAWLSADVGAVAIAGSETVNGSSITVRGSGADVWDTRDEFRFVYRQLSGDFTIEARVSSVTNTDGWAKAGVMLRESLNADARNVYAFVAAANGLAVQDRPTTGSPTNFTPGPWGILPPHWVRLTRTGNTLVGSASPDGISWTIVATHTMAFSAPVYAGLAVTSHNDGTLCTAAFTNVRLDGGATTPPPAAPTNLVAVPGTARIDLTWTDNATDEDGFRIERSADGTTFTEIATMPANATGYANTGLPAATTYSYRVRAARAAANSAYSNLASATTPGSSPLPAPSDLTATAVSSTRIDLSWRDNSSNETGFTIERSPDGVTFTQIGTTAANIATFSNAGLAPGTTYRYRVRASQDSEDSAFSNIATATTLTDSPPPSTWTGADIGSVATAGSEQFSGTGATVRGSGADIWDTRDEFRFAYRQLTGDCTIEARVVSLTNTDSWAKAGVMIREALTPGARYVYAFVSAAHGTVVQDRPTSDGATNFTPGPWGTVAPYWVRLVRTGNTIAGFVSADGVTWSRIATIAAPFNAAVYVGLAVTSHNDGALCTAAFEAIRVEGGTTTPPPPPPTAPAAPTNFTATANSASQITLSWTDNADNETGFALERSRDGTAFTALTTTSANLTSHVDSALTASTTYYYRARAINAAGASAYTPVASATTAAPPPPPPPPGAWESRDIGAVAAAGSTSESNGIVTLAGSGADIWNSRDEFRFRYQQLTGDGEIIARVMSLSNTDGWAKAGLMFRESLDAAARHAWVCLSAAHGTAFQYRATFGGPSDSAAPNEGVVAPRWIRLVRTGNIITAYDSPGGLTWNQLGTLTLALPETLYVGLAVTSHNDGVLCTATFDNVVVRGGSTPPPPPPPTIPAPSELVATATSATQINLTWKDNSTNETGFQIERATDGATFTPLAAAGVGQTGASDTNVTAGTTYTYRVRAVSGSAVSAYSNTASATPTATPPPPPPPSWSFADIGAVGLAGSNSSSGSSITISGSGSDIWDTADAFRFVYRAVTGDGVVEARVMSMQNTNGWAKAGVMIRESLTATSRNAFAFVTPVHHGILAQNREATGGVTTSIPGPGNNAPYWLRLTRRADTFTASASPDGITWTPYATFTVPMSATVYFGFAVTAHDNTQLNTAVFADPFIRAP